MGLLSRCQVSDSCTAHLEMRTRTKSVVARAVFHPTRVPCAHHCGDHERAESTDGLRILALQEIKVHNEGYGGGRMQREVR